MTHKVPSLPLTNIGGLFSKEGKLQRSWTPAQGTMVRKGAVLKRRGVIYLTARSPSPVPIVRRLKCSQPGFYHQGKRLEDSNQRKQNNPKNNTNTEIGGLPMKWQKPFTLQRNSPNLRSPTCAYRISLTLHSKI